MSRYQMFLLTWMEQSPDAESSRFAEFDFLQTTEFPKDSAYLSVKQSVKVHNVYCACVHLFCLSNRPYLCVENSLRRERRRKLVEISRSFVRNSRWRRICVDIWTGSLRLRTLMSLMRTGTDVRSLPLFNHLYPFVLEITCSLLITCFSCTSLPYRYI